MPNVICFKTYQTMQKIADFKEPSPLGVVNATALEFIESKKEDLTRKMPYLFNRNGGKSNLQNGKGDQ